ncbi:hypothetical protein CANCADRAFT_32053 [Tortispora caseinolytica NRRL Y-17796]|uniref:Fatty acid synthase subunit beta n=1 Tax=Tortispora caseinolytica NRRL Y-17796 TaxID=767744 RepID=A0A1E4TI19_9ASCO|nr:hypothetical protein CANCADRAFT_32053 [Tortispora caseinolytica NRRL Y-17796]
MYTGVATGASTPHSASAMRPVSLSHGLLEHTLLVPSSLYQAATLLRNDFQDQLPEATEEYALDEEPSSVPELLARFLSFVTDKSEDEPGQFDEMLSIVLREFETRFLQGNEVHAVAVALPGIPEKRREVIRAYYAARIALNRPIKAHQSALFRAVQAGSAKVFVVFGGQGNIEEYFDELREVHTVYGSIIEDFIRSIAEFLLDLTAHPDAAEMFPKGLDIMNWLANPSSTPDTDYLIDAPVSLPLIALTQFAHYAVTCKILGIHPGELRDLFGGATGHSQGVVTAAAISASDSWESFMENVFNALTILFWIAIRSQQKYPRTSLPPTLVRDSVEQGEGKPTPMLSVRELNREQIQKYVDLTNKHLPTEKHISISLANGSKNFVVTGPPQSLYGFNKSLRKIKAQTGMDQTRIPHTQRKLRISNKFLPISAPFHSPYSDMATEQVFNDIKNISLPAHKLGIPVFDTYDGHDLSTTTDPDEVENIIPRLVLLILRFPVIWPAATNFEATHIIDFGPGGVSGLGALTLRNKDGTGVRVIVGGAFEGGSNTELGFKSELFDREDSSVIYAMNWFKEFRPKLITNSLGDTFVDTKFTRLLGVPPVMVAGMTPTTVPPDFVAATMNAGFHIELAGGAYFMPSMLTKAIEYVEKHTTPGSGITINLIYVNPNLMRWAIPLVGELRGKGYPIEGITIGAGVPSLEVASEYINTLGLKHIAFKPGSTDAIQAVINIAKAHPNFPVILQWTGGRAGGHHSYEDFHAPILTMYGRIRRCPNIVLVAGSGFGGANDTYPYLTGQWSEEFSYPPMPFDAIVFGSRMMTAKEAHTSYEAKKAIMEAPGVSDTDWEDTYKKATGGVITVLSEMGEPIHKLATRGVLLWKEMDEKVFSLPKEKRVEYLLKHKDYIVKKLNADFQKPWFGCNSEGEACDLEDMTYAEVLKRLIELQYVVSEKRWIDVSLRNMTAEFIRRLEERFVGSSSSGRPSIIQNNSQLDDPYSFIETVINAYPEAKDQLLTGQDREYFIILCLNPMQKPVPFVPVLDDNFEFFFKKDSLWQSEDLAAVWGQDVQRTCILQGPVAARHTTKINQPIKEILGEIHESHIAYLKRDYYGGDSKAIPTIEYIGGNIIQDNTSRHIVEGLTEIEEKNRTIYCFEGLSDDAFAPSTDEWMAVLGGEKYSWRHAFFTSNVFVQGTKYQNNPARRLFAPSSSRRIVVENVDDIDKCRISIVDKVQGKQVETLTLFQEGKKIFLNLIEYRTADGKPTTLTLTFNYVPELGFAPIQEVMDNRNDHIKEFYWKLWFGSACPYKVCQDLSATFSGERVTITSKAIADFVHAVGNHGEAYVERQGKVTLAPIDFTIVLGWKSIIQAIFPKEIDGDLLKLVHLSNAFRVFPGQKPLSAGDVVETVAKINAVINQDSGKMVEVVGTVLRDGAQVIQVTSRFLYRGTYEDYENTFESKTETPMQLQLKSVKDIAVLNSKEWISLDYEGDLIGKTLTFRLQSYMRYKNSTAFSLVETTGDITMELPTNEVIQVGTVNYYEDSVSLGNPVIDYLQRNGKTIEEPFMFENATPLSDPEQPLILRAPGSNENYARVSGDYNPIHVSPVFAAYVGLHGNITHGMYTSAAVRSLVEVWAAESVSTRVRSYKCDFVGMVLPDDTIVVTLKQIGMINGRKIVSVEARNQETDTVVLSGEAEVEQPTSAFVFTGQGSQEQGMGMDLYQSSEVARKVWDRADEHFRTNYGFSIIDIVKNNPRERTVHFGGARGKRIRENYMSMMFEYVDSNGEPKHERIFKSIDENTLSYTFTSEDGLISATQFTQPALTLMEKAAFEDMKSKGLVPTESTFAGHSLGEYSALASLGNVLPIEALSDIVFYRGMTMQVAVPRDANGRSNYGMCAVNPSRVSPTFDDKALRYVVDHIGVQTGWLLEIVNFNVENQQYVTAGDLRGLDTMTNVLNILKVQKIDISKLMETLGLEKVTEHLTEIVSDVAQKSLEKPQPIDLERGFAVIPLKGISVPFHSTYLRNGVKPFRSFLSKKLPASAIKTSDLVGKYIPNLTARPFEITKDYFEEVYELTKSDRVKFILDHWDMYENDKIPASSGL